MCFNQEINCWLLCWCLVFQWTTDFSQFRITKVHICVQLSLPSAADQDKQSWSRLRLRSWAQSANISSERPRVCVCVCEAANTTRSLCHIYFWSSLNHTVKTAFTSLAQTLNQLQYDWLRIVASLWSFPSLLATVSWQKVISVLHVYYKQKHYILSTVWLWIVVIIHY